MMNMPPPPTYEDSQRVIIFNVHILYNPHLQVPSPRQPRRTTVNHPPPPIYVEQQDAVLPQNVAQSIPIHLLPLPPGKIKRKEDFM
jgi:hypothetical protein